MANEFLTEISCPNCLLPIDIRKHGRHVQCDACGSQFILEEHICPDCQTYHEDNTSFCTQCGQALTRLCHRCHTSNWPGDEYCRQCGNALDIFDLLRLHTNQGTVERLQQQMESAGQLKAQEEEASQKRMAELVAIEEARQAQLRRRQKKQKAQERKMLIVTFGSVAFFILIVILYTLFRLLT
jgi:hypothetical protein